MSVPTKKLVAEFTRKARRNPNMQEMELVDKIGFLNEAQEYVVDRIIQLEDYNKRYSNILRPLEVKKVKLSCEEVDKDCCKVAYPEDLYIRSNLHVVACKEGCKKDKRINVQPLPSDHINVAFQDPYNKANFAFEQLFGEESGKGFYIYHQGEMEIKEVYIDYIKFPNDLHAPSLADCEGEEFYYDYCGMKITQDSDLELSTSFIKNEIVNVAVLLATVNVNELSQVYTYLSQIIK